MSDSSDPEIQSLLKEVETLRAENATLRSIIAFQAIVEEDIELLSTRESQILSKLGAGLTTKEIAELLHLSASTIETYRERIKSKLNLKTGQQLTRFAVPYSLRPRTAKDELTQPFAARTGNDARDKN